MHPSWPVIMIFVCKKESKYREIYEQVIEQMDGENNKVVEYKRNWSLKQEASFWLILTLEKTTWRKKSFSNGSSCVVFIKNNISNPLFKLKV